MVRPEALRILRDDEAADNRLTAILRDVVMTGGTTLHLFRTPGGVELSARRLTDGRGEPRRRGDQAQLGFSSAHAFVIPEV